MDDFFKRDKWLYMNGHRVAMKHMLDKPGVYVVYINGILSYVGQSNTPRIRFYQHGINHFDKFETPWGEFDELYIKIKYPSSYGKEAMIEKRLLKKLKPRFNRYVYKRRRGWDNF